MDDFADHPLLLRYLTGECSPGEQAAFDAWMAESPHRAAYVASLREIHDTIGDQRPVEDSGAAWVRMRGRVAPSERPAGAGTRATSVRVGALASSRWAGRRSWWAGIAAAAVIVLGISITRLAGHSAGVDGWRALSTTAGNRATITLRDGTQLVLGPASQLRVPANFGRDERTVILEGQALFTVVHNTQHPFTVRTAHAVVQDVGTVFSVQSYAGDPDERIAVVEGEVHLGNAGLRAHDVAVIDAHGVIHVQRGVDVAPYTAWVQGRLVFSATPLRDVIRDIARVYDLQITLADSAVAQNAITASFDKESADEVLKEITQAIGAQYESRGRRITIRSGHAATLPAPAHHRPALSIAQTSVSTQPIP